MARHLADQDSKTKRKIHKRLANRIAAFNEAERSRNPKLHFIKPGSLQK